MIQRDLGRSGLRIPPIVLGGMFRDATAREAVLSRMLDIAFDHGLTAIDTAPLYGFGESEELLGRLLRGRRGRACLMTKVGLRWDDDWGDVLFATTSGGRRFVVRRDSRPEAVARDVEQSLARLGCETLDMVQVHHRDRQTPISETMGALLRLREAGKLRAIGVSNYSRAELLEASAALGDVPLASSQNELSLIEREASRDVLAFTRSLEVGFLAYSPLARGLLAGRMLGDTLSAADVRARGPLFQPRNVARINGLMRERMEPIADDRGVDLAAVALSWVVAQPGVTAAIAGAQDEGQLRGPVAATRLELAEDEKARIERGFASLRLDPLEGVPLRRRLRERLSGLVRRATSLGSGS